MSVKANTSSHLAVYAVTLDSYSIGMRVGSTLDLNPAAIFTDKSKIPIHEEAIFSSCDETVAKVNAGIIQDYRAGTAQIMVTYKEKSTYALVFVR